MVSRCFSITAILELNESVLSKFQYNNNIDINISVLFTVSRNPFEARSLN